MFVSVLLVDVLQQFKHVRVFLLRVAIWITVTTVKPLKSRMSVASLLIRAHVGWGFIQRIYFQYITFYFCVYIIERVGVFLPADQRSGKLGPCFALCVSIQPDSVWSNNHETDGQPDKTSELTDSRVVHRGIYTKKKSVSAALGHDRHTCLLKTASCVSVCWFICYSEN